LIIDASSFPQAAGSIMTAIREAGLNLNPQQDGLKIFVPIPKAGLA
jgi:ribosome recycling factor